jgi:hypothetical protein
MGSGGGRLASSTLLPHTPIGPARLCSSTPLRLTPLHPSALIFSQASYNEELEEIEIAFLQERSDLLGSNRGEMQELFDKRSRLEQEFMER